MLISAEHISKKYLTKNLLEDVCLYLNEGERIGIIGVNGTGKSTLLKILAGVEKADLGNVSSDRNVQISYLSQNPKMRDDNLILEQVFEGLPKGIREVGEYEAKAMLNKLGIVDLDQKIATLSGGQRKRVALASALIHKADVLILDEPTNHLDSEMVSWLEQYLVKYSGGIIMVTHDRYFLERVVTRIAELSNGTMYTYVANYSKYLELKAQRLEMDQASLRKKQSLLRKESEWILQGPTARGTKSKDRIARYEDLREQNLSLDDDKVKMVSMSSRLGKKIIELKEVSKSFGDNKVLDSFSYNILRGDRIGIVGRNGVGKSTLLNIITGEVVPDSGEVDTGITVKIGYFSQENKELDLDMRVYDYICSVSGEIKTSEGTFSATQMLERFLFTSETQYTNIGRLSGGERRRLYLLSILMTAPNILLLDEPTNDLDIETLTILEEYLETFAGAVFSVSHDRYFLDKVAQTIFEVGENGNIKTYNGNYSDYIEARTVDGPVTVKKESAGIKNIPPRQKKLKFTFNEQREFETIDDDIEMVEQEIKQCIIDIENSASEYEKLQEFLSKKEQLEVLLEEKTQRWIYLNELAEKIANEDNY